MQTIQRKPSNNDNFHTNIYTYLYIYTHTHTSNKLAYGTRCHQALWHDLKQYVDKAELPCYTMCLRNVVTVHHRVEKDFMTLMLTLETSNS